MLKFLQVGALSNSAFILWCVYINMWEEGHTICEYSILIQTKIFYMKDVRCNIFPHHISELICIDSLKWSMEVYTKGGIACVFIIHIGQ